jgi:acyl-CoA-binding protein
MSDLTEAFEQAAQDVLTLSEEPDNETKLELYALYKQGTNGDVQGKRPGRLKMVKRAKYDAWADKKGMSQDDAQQAYVDLVGDLMG